jgi:REP element-mobilizing transposase RayT
MVMDPWHCRRVHRLPGHDYSSPGAYFVTVGAHERRRLFGVVTDGRFVPNDAGRMVDDAVTSLPGRFAHVRVDTSVVMPDHVHLILVLGKGAGATTRVAPTLGDIVGAFKSVTTVAYVRGVRQSGWPPFSQRLWQRDYHDHLIRDPLGLERIRRYILDNPRRWHP